MASLWQHTSSVNARKSTGEDVLFADAHKVGVVKCQNLLYNRRLVGLSYCRKFRKHISVLQSVIWDILWLAFIILKTNYLWMTLHKMEFIVQTSVNPDGSL